MIDRFVTKIIPLFALVVHTGTRSSEYTMTTETGNDGCNVSITVTEIEKPDGNTTDINGRALLHIDDLSKNVGSDTKSTLLCGFLNPLPWHPTLSLFLYKSCFQPLIFTKFAVQSLQNILCLVINN